ncbi:Fungalysin/Thermolysin Extracellular metalloproteinase 5 [Phlyctochytrium planicorne]|nr:Fungalysin/Thermolysin Extracellular metalloproteinase 5 [Phlyctochytrium planicorne]
MMEMASATMRAECAGLPFESIGVSNEVWESILFWLPDPSPLLRSCKALHHIGQSPATKANWLRFHHNDLQTIFNGDCFEAFDYFDAFSLQALTDSLDHTPVHPSVRTLSLLQDSKVLPLLLLNAQLDEGTHTKPVKWAVKSILDTSSTVTSNRKELSVAAAFAIHTGSVKSLLPILVLKPLLEKHDHLCYCEAIRTDQGPVAELLMQYYYNGIVKDRQELARGARIRAMGWVGTALTLHYLLNSGGTMLYFDWDYYAERVKKRKLVECGIADSDIYSDLIPVLHHHLQKMNIELEDFAEEAILSGATHNDINFLEALLSLGLDMSEGGYDALEAASRLGNLEAVRWLVEHNVQASFDDSAALRAASASGHASVVAYLGKNGADIGAKNNEAILVASAEGHAKCVMACIELGANIHQNKNAALKSACEANHVDVVEVLLSGGASPSEAFGISHLVMSSIVKLWPDVASSADVAIQTAETTNAGTSAANPLTEEGKAGLLHMKNVGQKKMKILLIASLALQLVNRATGHVAGSRPYTQTSFGIDLTSRFEKEIHFDAAAASSIGKHAQGTKIDENEAVERAIAYASEKLNSFPSNVREHSSILVKDAHRSEHSGVTHVYLAQYYQGLEISNALANVNVDAQGKILSFYSTFYNGTQFDREQDSEKDLVFQANSESDMLVIESQKGHRLRSRTDAAFNDIRSQIKLTPSDAMGSFAAHLKKPLNAANLAATPVMSILPSKPSSPDFIIENAGTVSDVNAKLKIVQTAEGKLIPAWDLEVDYMDNYFNGWVSAINGDVLTLVDWVSDAQYRVYPFGTNDPDCGDRVLVENPHHPLASPAGWHRTMNATAGHTADTTETWGNNVYAQENLDGGSQWPLKKRPDGGKTLIFDYPIDLNSQPSTYLDASVTNLFYWNNLIHDLFYVYGFTEKAGNFQNDNFGKGGQDGDAVIANAQDGSGYNNANFATPPDGRNGRMRMYVWDRTDPMRDGDLSADIIQHEYTHGMSIRLTGGPSNSGCLGWGEAGGMGEGWGDFIATITRTTSNSTRTDDFAMGEYAMGGSGIRNFKYSTSMETNPSTYAYVSKPGYWGVHAKGEVWAEILYEMYWNLVDELGFNPNWFDTTYAKALTKASKNKLESRNRSSGTVSHIKIKPSQYGAADWDRGGNILALQIVIDGLKLQPCNPSFVDARDAILLAETVLTGGKNNCLIWKAFAKRGLGYKAKPGGREDFRLSPECQTEQ